ncbi:hypothetical protein [Pseudoalteromonas obscura]|uniref:Uncharacterized protein n=1 Tax=Pseudoalteromonas obscura TaxID=3048491 RepID=A0ABT7EIX9_9GAMM|nr:hypothetical protein [Pseudoalteromonas sp. P94(2023)]MDK2595016.1 hypothetical protein [Pseudoalteromonas sp. P94(2023)]
MKLLKFIYVLLVTFSGLAESIEFNLEPSLPVVKEVLIDLTSREQFTQQINKRYKGKVYRCGVIYPPLTPDEALKQQYDNQTLREIVTFTQVIKVNTYTPIRQLAKKPVAPAIFNGHYFVSQ